MRASIFVYPVGRRRRPGGGGPHRRPRRPAGHSRLRLPLHAGAHSPPPPAPRRHRPSRRRALPTRRAPLGGARPAAVHPGLGGRRGRLRRGGPGPAGGRTGRALLGRTRPQLAARRRTPPGERAQRLWRPLPLGALHRPAGGAGVPGRPRRGGRGAAGDRYGRHGTGVLRLVRPRASARPRQDRAACRAGGGAVPDVPVLLPRCEAGYAEPGGPGRLGPGRAGAPSRRCGRAGGPRGPTSGPTSRTARGGPRGRHHGVAGLGRRHVQAPRWGCTGRRGTRGFQRCCTRTRPRTAAEPTPASTPQHILGHADGLVLPGADLVAACVPYARAGTVLAANFPVVTGMGAAAPARSPRTRPGRRPPGRRSCASTTRGSASAGDLAAVRAFLTGTG